MEKTYTINELADEFGVTLRAIRFYEEHGLISPQRQGRQRVFSRRDRVRLKLILRGKRIGLQLSEVREVIDLYDASRDEASQSLKLLAAIMGRRRQLEQQKRDIEDILDEIDQLEAHCRQVIDDMDPTPPAG